MFNLWNFLAYQLAWFAVLISAGFGVAWAGATTAVLIAGVHVALRREPLELQLIALAALIGVLVDSTLAITGQVHFA